MKNQKNIWILSCLLLWVALLCFSDSSKQNELSHTYAEYESEIRLNKDFANEVLLSTDTNECVAWLEEIISPGIPNHLGQTWPILLLVVGLLLYQNATYKLKPIRAKIGFASLSAQFRILPNAP